MLKTLITVHKNQVVRKGSWPSLPIQPKPHIKQQTRLSRSLQLEIVGVRPDQGDNKLGVRVDSALRRDGYLEDLEDHRDGVVLPLHRLVHGGQAALTDELCFLLLVPFYTTAVINFAIWKRDLKFWS